MTPHARFLAIADRLRRLPAGSPEADSYIHRALDRPGPVLPYTRDEAAALLLLPPGFEADWPTTIAGETYAAVWRRGLLDGLPHPHHGQWGATRALALCGAVMRAHAKLARLIHHVPRRTLANAACPEAWWSEPQDSRHNSPTRCKPLGLHGFRGDAGSVVNKTG